MAPTLYTVPGSPPVRAVLMTAHSIGLTLNRKALNLGEGEHKSPEFLKLNPQHTVPTLVEEDGFVLWDSHAIMPYLLTKYGNDDSLYPSDAKKRAVVDQRLHFDSGVSWAIALRILRPMIYEGKRVILQEDISSLQDAYGFVESFLDKKQWIAGDSVTIADYSFIATLSTLDVLVKIDTTKFPKLAAWRKRVEKLPAYQATKGVLEDFIAFITPLLP